MKIPNKMKKTLLIAAFACLLSNNTNAASVKISFEEHVKQLKQEIEAKGYDSSILDKVFEGKFVQDKKVKKALSNQPEVKFSFDKYVGSKLSDWRIKTGRELYLKHYDKLKEFEDKYKVDASIMIALWGLETNYGTYPLGHNAFKALTNMTYTHSRESRREFFKRELFDLFELAKQNQINPLELKSSWAGALGQCQFMPSNVLKYAKDGNNDGVVDIWNTLDDVFASTANFVNTLGWDYDVTNNIEEVSVPKGYNILAKRVYKPIYDWKKQKVLFKAGYQQTNINKTMKMFAPVNKSNSVYLVSKNFDVIKRWNNSDYFAFSVLALSDEIKKVKK